jgi:hypothetical protein
MDHRRGRDDDGDGRRWNASAWTMNAAGSGWMEAARRAEMETGAADEKTGGAWRR